MAKNQDQYTVVLSRVEILALVEGLGNLTYQIRQGTNESMAKGTAEAVLKKLVDACVRGPDSA